MTTLYEAFEALKKYYLKKVQDIINEQNLIRKSSDKCNNNYGKECDCDFCKYWDANKCNKSTEVEE